MYFSFPAPSIGINWLTLGGKERKPMPTLEEKWFLQLADETDHDDKGRLC
jgi:hypothetical protein